MAEETAKTLPEEPKTTKESKKLKLPKWKKESGESDNPKSGKKSEKEPKTKKEPKAPKPKKELKFPKKPKTEKEPKAEKAPKPKKEPKSGKESGFWKKRKTEGEAKEDKEEKPLKKSEHFLFGLKNKIYICFIVPIIFMVAVGLISYHYAAEGLSDKFKEASRQTANMAIQYLDTSCTYIQAEVLGYAFDSDVEKYVIGMPGKSVVEKANYISDERVSLLAAQTSNPFVNNIHIIPKAGIQIITSQTSDKYDGIYDAYCTEMMEYSEDGRNLPKWIEEHPLLDEQLGLNAEDYFLAYQMQTSQKFAYVVADVKTQALMDILEDMDFGNGSITGFVTNSGKEMICENLAEGESSRLNAEESIFAQQAFYAESLAGEDTDGAMDVTWQGEDYLYIYAKSDVCNVTLCSLIPLDVVTGQAEKIKTVTITLVILAVLISLCIGSFIAFGIQRNMNGISGKLDEVAKGDLTVSVRARGKDEFGNLATTATNMIQNNKKLVRKLAGTVQQLEASASDVNNASEDINNYSEDITRAIDEISAGMTKQAEHAQECVVKTNNLSDRIQDINTMVEEVEDLVDRTEKMIAQGTEIVNLLGDRARETSEITSRVGSSIVMLKNESETINGFVETISNISKQTNLLSLNASIEAARAGAAGRGFSVVAEEIRKLADDSNKAADEIRHNVENIAGQTMNSVKSAREAEEMVALQAKAVDEVISVFENMNQQMTELFSGLKRIADQTETADKERNDTMDAVENISAIIQETASSSELVRDMAERLLSSVEELNQTAKVLDEDMNGLKTEISAFKIE
jgi:methyl-accepting chemotaxis protein